MAFTDWQQNFKDNPGRIEQVPHFKLYPKSTGHTEKSARPPPRLATLLFEREYAVAEAGYSSLVANDGSVFTVVPRDAVDGSVLRVEHTTNIFSSPSSSHESGSRRKRKKSRQLHRAPSTTPEAPHLPDDDLALHVTPSEQPQLEDDAQSSSSSCDTKPSGTLLVSQPLPSRRTRQCPRSMAAARPAQARDGESVSGIVKEEATNVDTNESSKRQRLCPSTAAASARHGAANMESSQAEASSAAPSTQRSRLCPRSRAPTASMYGSTTTSYTSKHEDEDSKAFVGGSLPDGGSLLDNGTLLTGCSPPDGGTVLATRAGAPAAASRTQPLAQAGVGALSSHSSTVSAKGPLGEGGGGGGGGGNSAALASDSAFVAGCPWTTTAARAAVRLSQQENHS